MSKHTKGPWVALRDNPGQFQVATVELIGVYSSHQEYGGTECGAPEHDARLIAAAPDLLEALQSLTHSLELGDMLHDDQRAAFAAARAAIAKATHEEPT